MVASRRAPETKLCFSAICWYFSEIKNSIHEYRDEHLPFICSISRQTSQVLNETNKNKNPEELEKHFPFLTAAKAKNNCVTNEDDTRKKLQKIASEKLQLYGDLEDVDENSVSLLFSFQLIDHKLLVEYVSLDLKNCNVYDVATLID